MEITLSLILKIVEKCVSIDKTFPDKILGLNQIYLNLVEHGSQSEYSVQVLQFMFGQSEPFSLFLLLLLTSCHSPFGKRKQKKRYISLPVSVTMLTIKDLTMTAPAFAIVAAAVASLPIRYRSIRHVVANLNKPQLKIKILGEPE